MTYVLDPYEQMLYVLNLYDQTMYVQEQYKTGQKNSKQG